MKVKDENEKTVLKLNIQKTRIMASSPITSWQTDGETIETGADFIFLGSEITVHSDFEAQENKICHRFYFSPSICHKVMGPDAMILIF